MVFAQQKSTGFKMNASQLFFLSPILLGYSECEILQHIRHLRFNSLQLIIFATSSLCRNWEWIYLYVCIYVFIFTFLPTLSCFSYYSHKPWGSASFAISVRFYWCHAGFLNLYTIAIWCSIILCWWAILCIVGWLAVSLASTPNIPTSLWQSAMSPDSVKYPMGKMPLAENYYSNILVNHML